MLSFTAAQSWLGGFWGRIKHWEMLVSCWTKNSDAANWEKKTPNSVNDGNT